MITKTTGLVALLLCCTSCASIINGSYTQFEVITNTPAQVIVEEDTLMTLTNNKVRVSTKRSPNSLSIQVRNDSISKVIDIPARRSWAYWGNAYPLLWPGFFVDGNKALSYTYRGPIYINMQDTVAEYYPWPILTNDKKWMLHLSIPYFNSFYLQPDGEDPQYEAGFWGISLGADYHYKRNRSVHLSVSGASSFFLPIPAAVDISGEWQIAGSWFVTAAHQHHWNRFQLGYGLSFARNVWEWKYSEIFDPLPPTRPEAYRQNNSLGAQLSGYARTGKRFYLGFLYRPTFLRFNSSEQALAYEHLISLDLAWKFRLN
ncbi:MAG: hypothetical protein AAGG75_02360 [Bacteroidota bacterium]